MSHASRSGRSALIQSLEPRLLLWGFSIFGWEYDSDWFDGWNSGSGNIGAIPSFEIETSLAETNPARRAVFDRLGNAFVAGTFPTSDMVDFQPGAGEKNLSEYAGEIYLARYTSHGKLSWARQVGVGGWNMAVSTIERDTLGNLYLVGTFQGVPDFDPSDSVYTVHGTASPDIFGGTVEYGTYVSKYTPAGDLIWAQTFDGAANAMAVDPGGNILLTGSFFGTADLAPRSDVRNLVARGSNDIFVSKLNKDGRLIWAVQFGGASDDTLNRDAGLDIATNAAGNVFVTGAFTGTADFNPNRKKVANLTSAGREDAFFVGLDRGGRLLWANRTGGEFDDAGSRIAVAATGELFAAGMSAGNISNGTLDTFVTRIAPSTGKAEWTDAFRSASLGDLFVAPDASVYTTGKFSTTDFDPGDGVRLFSTMEVIGGGFVSHLSKKGIDLGAAQFGSDNYLTCGNALSLDTTGRINVLAIMPVPWRGTTTLPQGTFSRNLFSSTFDSHEELAMLQIDSASLI